MKPREEWLLRQCLPPQRGATAGDVVRRGGWIASAGGTGPYVALKARIPSLTRQHIDQLVFQTFEIVEVPGPRTSFLVPREEAGLALAAGRRAFAQRTKKLDIKPKEIALLGDRILGLIGSGVRSNDQLRREIPAKLIRDLGPEGARAALQNTLAVALRQLMVDGALLRVGEDRRLDGKLHFYRAWPGDISIDAPEDLDGALAERFAAWAWPATVDEFAAWAGITKTAAKRVFPPVAPPAPHARAIAGTAFLPFRDNFFALHRGIAQFMEQPKGVKLLDFSNKPAPIERLDSLHHNAIVVDGELAGIWEYERDGERIAYRTFGRVDVAAAAAGMERFIRDELGDHKYYALDHTAGREVRLQFIHTN